MPSYAGVHGRTGHGDRLGIIDPSDDIITCEVRIGLMCLNADDFRLLSGKEHIEHSERYWELELVEVMAFPRSHIVVIVGGVAEGGRGVVGVGGSGEHRLMQRILIVGLAAYGEVIEEAHAVIYHAHSPQ